MTASDIDSVVAELGPVREALLSRAHADADAERAQADADGDARITAARAEAQRITAEARAQGEADAALLLAADSARTRRRAHATVLRAQQAAFEELRRRSRDAVRALRTDPTYPQLVDRLVEMVRRELGDGAVISEHPNGGVIADAPGRHVELSLDTLADDALGELGADVTGLWSP